MGKKSSHLIFCGSILLVAFIFRGNATISAPLKWNQIPNCRYIYDSANDGDSFHVQNKAEKFIFRFYYIDAPECDLSILERSREQSEYFGVTFDDLLVYGKKARDVVRSMLRDPFDVHTRWAIAPGRSREHRYYGLIYIRGQSLVETLVKMGLARLKGVRVQLPDGRKAKEYNEYLLNLEKQARLNRVGIWAKSKKL
jgi:endonuclease YncB( thermonuclease family)